ncbi:MAG: cytochrome P450 [Parachlamydiales bacterium]|nr:cytochrome P450 [Parachlamydiales bacterium]
MTCPFRKIDPSQHNYNVSFSRAEPVKKSWLTKIISFPISLKNSLQDLYAVAVKGNIRTALENRYNRSNYLSQFNPFQKLIFSAEPAVMKEILNASKDDPEGLFLPRNVKSGFSKFLSDVLGETLLPDDSMRTCSDKMAKNFRKPLSKFIGLSSIRNHTQILEEIAIETVKNWGKTVTVEVNEQCNIYTATVISKLMIGHPGIGESYSDIADATNYFNKYLAMAEPRQIFCKKFSNEYKQSVCTIRNAFNRCMTLASTDSSDSLIKEMIKEGLSPIQIKSTFFLSLAAGVETTSSLLTYLLWQLGQDKQAQILMREELNNEKTLYEAATQSVFLDSFFSESLRMFTPVYMLASSKTHPLKFSVKDHQDKVVHEERIDKDSLLVVTPTFAARNPDRFENPDSFEPTRFLNNNEDYSWLPFGFNKHTCPGKNLAIKEIKLLVAEIMRNYEISSHPNEEITTIGYFTLKVSENVQLRLKPLKKAE